MISNQSSSFRSDSWPRNQQLISFMEMYALSDLVLVVTVMLMWPVCHILHSVRLACRIWKSGDCPRTMINLLPRLNIYLSYIAMIKPELLPPVDACYRWVWGNRSVCYMVYFPKGKYAGK